MLPARVYTSKFVHLQALTDVVDGVPSYDIDINDTYYVFYWVAILSFLRSFFMQWILRPVAKKLLKIHSKKAIVRFTEQSWLVVYYSCSFATGLYLYVGSPYWNNVEHIYIGWPHYRMLALFKAYYLVSTAFWLQQLVVLNIEEKRKDHVQMFSHHIITCALVIGSYYYYFTRIGHLILMIMDSVDIFLSTAKILKYSGFTHLCDVMFVLFLVSWVFLRHGVYNYLFYISWKDATTLMASSECIDGLVQKRCWNSTVVNSFLSLLGGLQIITCIWMYFILKVAIKVITGTGADDVRSDDDDTDVETESDSRQTSETLTDTLAETSADDDEKQAELKKTIWKN